MSKPTRRLDGKVALITGAANGLGEETARLFAANGAYVVVADINDELGQKVATSIGVDQASFHHCDVRDENQVEETVSYTVEKYGRLDILVSNAGITGSLTSILEYDMSNFDNVISTNVRGVVATIKHAGQAMVKGNIRGSIICMASTASVLGGIASTAYITSKHAVLGVVRSCCGELGAYGIRVNCVSPYAVATRLTCEFFNMEESEVEELVSASASLKGVALKASHVAEAVVFLASDESAYISGQNLVVDGGFTAVKSIGLQGKVALITGAASGIGEETARLFAANGAIVVIADIQDELGQKLAAEIGQNQASFHHCDVRDEVSVEKTVAFTVEKHGRLDILFSNAGMMGPLAGILDLDMEEFENTMRTNVKGVTVTVKHAARAMVKSKTRGSIICTSSVAAAMGGVGPAAYTVSKSAVVGVVKTACSELGKYGIRVNGVSPYGVATPMTCESYNISVEEAERNTSSLANLKGIVLKCRHVAEAVLFLASDESAYVSGHNLTVDGGFTVVCSSIPPPDSSI